MSSIVYASNNEKITIQLKWFHQFQFAGYYAAIEKGFYAEEGLDVELRERVPSTSHINDVLEGRARYGVADSGLLLSRLQGQPVVLLSQIFQHSPLVMLSLNDSGIRTPYDLLGKRVMFDMAGKSDASISAMLLDTLDGIESIDFTDMSFRYEDLIEGKVDVMSAYSTDQPFWFQQQGIEVNIIDPRDYGADFYGDNLFTTEQEIKENPLRVEQMRRATLKGWRYALEHQDEIIELILKKYNNHNLTRAHLEYEARETSKMIVADYIELGHFEPSRFQKIAETYARLGKSQTATIDSLFFYDSKIEQLGLTKKEQAWLAEHPVIRVSHDMSWPPFDFHENDEPTGFSIDHLELLASRIGFKIEYINGHWFDLLDKARNKKLDMMLNIAKSPERSKFLLFTKSYVNNPTGIFVHVNNKDIKSIDDLKAGRKVSVGKGFYQEEILRKAYPDMSLVPVKNTLEGLGAVSAREVDAHIDFFAVGNHVAGQQFITGINAIGLTGIEELDNTPLSYGVRDDWSILVSILEKGMATIKAEEISLLKSKWLRLSTEKLKGNQLVLTEKEQAWLYEHPTIRFTGDPDWLPQEAFTKDGKYIGMVAEILDLLESRLGVNFERVPSKTWGEAVRLAETRKVDVLSETAGTDRKGLSFTNSHLKFPIAIITRTNTYPILNADELRGKRVAVVRDYGYVKIFQENYPDLDYQVVDSVKDGLLSVSSGRADAFLSATSTASHLISELGLTNLRFSGTTGLSIDLAFGIRKDWPVLVGLINRAIENFGPREMASIKKHWLVGTELDEMPRIELSRKESKWLNAHPEITLGFMSEAEPLLIVQPDGSYQGILVDLYRELEAITGMKVKFEVDKWPLLIQKAKKTENDGLLNGATTLINSIGLTSADAWSKVTPTVFSRKDAAFEINSEKDLIGKKISVLKGVYVVEQALKDIRDKVEIIETESTLEMLKLVLEGHVDAAFGISYHNYHIGKYNLIGIEPRYFSTKFQTDLSFGLRSDWPEAVSILNKGLEKIGKAGISKIVNKWIGLDEKYLNKVILTQEEKRWIDGHKKIRLGVDSNWAPFEYFDFTGSYSGISSGYVRYLNKLLNIDMQPLQGLSWAEVIQKAKLGEIDVLPAMMRSPERAEYLNFTEPYISLPMVIFSRKDAVFSTNMNELKDKKIAVIKGYITEELFRREYPTHHFILVDNIESALQAVSAGKADAFVGNLASITYATNKLGITNLQLTGTTRHNFELAFAVRKDWPELINILNRSIKALPNGEKENIKARWLNVRIEKQTDYSIIWKVILVAVLLLLFITYWNRRLNAAKKAAETAGEQLRLFMMLAESSGQGVGMARLDASITYMNPRLRDMCGVVGEEEALNSKFISYYSKWAQQKLTNEILPILMKDRQWTGELELQTTEEKTTPTIDNFFLVKDKNGDPLFIADIVTDISERKKIEALIKRSEERFQQSLNFATIGTWDLDIGSGDLHWSDQIAPLFGYPTGQLETTYENFIAAVHPDDRNQLQEAIQACIEKGSDYDIEHRVVWPSGEIRWLSERGATSKDEEGKPLHMLGVVQDITERKLAQDALQSKTMELQSFNEAMVDREGRVIELKEEVNRLCEELGREKDYPPVWGNHD